MMKRAKQLGADFTTESFFEEFNAAGLTYPVLRIYAESHDDQLAQLRIFDEEVRKAL